MLPSPWIQSGLSAHTIVWSVSETVPLTLNLRASWSPLSTSRLDSSPNATMRLAWKCVVGSVLPPRHRMPSGARSVSSYADAMAGFERTLIQSALVAVGGKVPAAARLLGLSRATVYNKMAQLGLVSGTPDARPGRQTMKKTT